MHSAPSYVFPRSRYEVGCRPPCSAIGPCHMSPRGCIFIAAGHATWPAARLHNSLPRSGGSWWPAHSLGTAQRATEQASHRDSEAPGSELPRQRVTGQRVTKTGSHRAGSHRDSESLDKSSRIPPRRVRRTTMTSF